ncbi:MAG: hypothetical protein U9N49_11565 [Campylobacterota bacterium]|nr:hypothetical protein [Campylobacterota bacterium]
MTDQELKDLVANLAISQAQSDAQMQKIFHELAQSKKETDKQMQKTDKEMKKIFRELAESKKETDEQMKKSDEEIEKIFRELAESDKKTDAKLDRVAKLVGSISNNQGDVAEEFFWNSISDNPVLAGITYDYADKNVTRKKGNTEDEYDILLVNGKDVAIIETKYKAHEHDIIKLINKKYANFQKLYPEYKDYNHHLGLASFYINDDIKNEALKNNIMVLQRKGDVIETLLP